MWVILRNAVITRSWGLFSDQFVLFLEVGPSLCSGKPLEQCCRPLQRKHMWHVVLFFSPEKCQNPFGKKKKFHGTDMTTPHVSDV